MSDPSDLYEGRLELDWVNKNKRLLSNEDGQYRWVAKQDYRVNEVRLLHDVRSHGDVSANRANDNLLIRGDALNALHSLNHLPEFREHYPGKVKLAYIDPPFNTRQAFATYADTFNEHSVWLTMMRDRLELIKEMLSSDGSIWIHCDDFEQAYLRITMDEVFGADRFVATIVWENRYSRSNDAGVSVSHNYLIIYALNRGVWNKLRNRLPRSSNQSKQYRNPDNDPRGPWRAIPWDAPNVRSNLSYPIRTPAGTIRYPPSGRCWSRTEDQWLAIVDSGLAYFGRSGNGAPAFKQFLSEASPLVPNTWWPHDQCGHSDEAKKEILEMFPNVLAFPTPKPERLMQRVIHVASNPGDIVLDCFLGSGTTAAVAHKMGRRWVGIEREVATIEDFAEPRLAKVIAGDDPGGITDAVDWEGGGGFRVLEVAPSMYEEENGRIVLSNWARNDELAKAVAAQYGYPYDPDPPFAGKKGRSRLAVIDGLVNADVIDLLLPLLEEHETLHVCGTALHDQVIAYIAAKSPGSKVGRIPDDMLANYGRKYLRKRRWERVGG